MIDEKTIKGYIRLCIQNNNKEFLIRFQNIMIEELKVLFPDTYRSYLNADGSLKDFDNFMQFYIKDFSL